MSKFMFEALDSSCQQVRDTVEAETREEAVDKVRSLGYFPTRIKVETDSVKPFGVTYRQSVWDRKFSVTMPLYAWAMLGAIALLILFAFVMVFIAYC